MISRGDHVNGNQRPARATVNVGRVWRQRARLSRCGGCAEAYGRSPRDNPAEGIEPMDKDELQTAMIPLRTRDGHPVLTEPDVMPGPASSYIAYGINWANVSNTPFRYYKARNHEGGIATPLIAHWPQGITARNELRHEPGHLIDFMPTFVELAGADYPGEFDGHSIPPMEGRSLVAGFSEDRPDEDRVLIWEHYLNAAIRKGRWKLVRLREGGYRGGETSGWTGACAWGQADAGRVENSPSYASYGATAAAPDSARNCSIRSMARSSRGSAVA